MNRCMTYLLIICLILELRKRIWPALIAEDFFGSWTRRLYFPAQPTNPSLRGCFFNITREEPKIFWRKDPLTNNLFSNISKAPILFFTMPTVGFNLPEKTELFEMQELNFKNQACKSKVFSDFLGLKILISSANRWPNCFTLVEARCRLPFPVLWPDSREATLCEEPPPFAAHSLPEVRPESRDIQSLSR